RFLEVLFLELMGERNGFDGHHPVDVGVAPQVDRAHGALAQFTFYFVAAQSLATVRRWGTGTRTDRGTLLAVRFRSRQCRRRHRRGFWPGADGRWSRFAHRWIIFDASAARTKVAVVGVARGNVIVDGRGFLILAPALEIHAEII